MTAASPVKRFRKRPVVVSAIRWTGDNEAEVREFAGGLFGTVDPEDRGDDPEITAEVLDKLHSTWVGVKTGQWVVRGIRGEFYPLDDEVRLDSYDPAAGPEAPGMTPGQAVYEAHQAFMIRCFPGIASIGWDELSGEALAGWEGIAQSGITAGGWDALAAEIESLAPGDGVTAGSTILAQVCRAVAARLTGSRPKGEVSVWIDDEGNGDAKVTVAWGAPRQAEKTARGEAGEEPWFPGGDPRDDDWTGGYRPGIEGD